MDEQADPQFVGQIRVAALAVAGVEEVETLWVRKSGLEFFVDIHIEVDQHLSVADGHRIGHQRTRDRKSTLLLASRPRPTRGSDLVAEEAGYPRISPSQDSLPCDYE